MKVDPAKGLSSAEAQQRLQQYGRNELAAKKKEPGWLAFLRRAMVAHEGDYCPIRPVV